MALVFPYLNLATILQLVRRLRRLRARSQKTLLLDRPWEADVVWAQRPKGSAFEPEKLPAQTVLWSYADVHTLFSIMSEKAAEWS